MREVAVVGGGIAGLAAAYEILRAPNPPKVYLLEAQGRLGGTILTEEVDGFLVEGGPDCLLAEKPWALDLARELGIGHRVVPALAESAGTYVLWRGRLRRLPEGFLLLAPTRIVPFLLSDLLSPVGKLRVLFEPLIPSRRYDGDESLADFVSRRLGREVLERVAEPLVAGVHGGSPEVLSLEATFPRFREMEVKYGGLIRGLRALAPKGGTGSPFVSFEGGMGELVEALEKAVEGAEVRLGSPVEAVEGAKKGFSLHTAGGTLQVDALILAIPSWAAAEVLRSLAPRLSELLEEIPYVSSATLSLAFEAGEVRGLKGHGFVVPRKEGRRLMAVTFSSRKFAGRAPHGKVLLRAFLGGARDEGVLELGDGELLELVLRELGDVLGIEASPLFWRIYRWPKALAQYRVGHRGLVAAVEGELQGLPGLFLAGGAYYGIGVGDCVRSGREAARRALEFLGN